MASRSWRDLSQNRRQMSLPRLLKPVLLRGSLTTGCVVQKVLLVSNDQVIIDRTAAMLEDFGCEVYVATDEYLAGDACADVQPDTAIVDIEMPGGRGFEAISLIRRNGVGIFVIAVTRGAHREVWPKVAEACGATQYITGPISASKLVNAVTDNGELH